MREKFLVIFFALCILPMTTAFANAEGQTHIMVNNERTDLLDNNSDGDADSVNVVASISTSAGNAVVAMEIVATTEDLSISFWNNTTLQSGSNYLLVKEVKAWSNAEYSFKLRVWDIESGLIVYDQDLAVHELVASLSAPELSMTLVAQTPIFSGDSCQIERYAIDGVGAHYGQLGTVSIQGAPWLIPENTVLIDCSEWPAGEYTISEHYRNGLGMVAVADLSFTVYIHPPPHFIFNLTGGFSQTGEPCNLAINGTQDTMLQEMTIEWEVINPSQESATYGDEDSIDCTMWPPGVHKVRATLTSPQGRETTEAMNLIRLPPSADASLAVKNASGDSTRWPEVSAGSDYEPEPVFLSLSATIAVVGAGGFLFAVFLGLLISWIMDREKQVEEENLWTEEGVPDSEGLPSFVDEEGIHWRQQPDGSVDWWDNSTGIWMPFDQ